MVYRVPLLDVPADDPYRHDSLHRKPIVEFLANLLEATGGPFVIALDATWGSGKTTVVRMLEAELAKREHLCVYFNAWQIDYVTDPLIALVAAVDQLKLPNESANTGFQQHLKKVRKITEIVAKRGAVAAGKALTAGLVDVERGIETAMTELVGESIKDTVDAFQKEAKLLETFRSELSASVEKLSESGKKSTLVIFIDELDRCRPTFAIELLERVKHLFDVPNIAFVLSLDMQQLKAITACVYGDRIDAQEYLRRFIDLEYALPTPTTNDFTVALLKRFGLDRKFATRTNPELRHDMGNFIDYFTQLADMAGLSLRARERCMTRLRTVMDQTPNDHHLDPIFVALLLVLRSEDAALFRRLWKGEAGPDEVLRYLSELPGGQEFVSDHPGVVLEAYLIAADPIEDRRKQKVEKLRGLAADPTTTPDRLERVNALISLRSQLLPGRRFGHLDIDWIAGKVDLSARIKN